MKQYPIIVFVTGQKQCEHLIKAGRMLATADTPLRVVSIQPRHAQDRPAAELEHLFQVCSSVGASMTVLYEDAPPAKAAIRYIKKSGGAGHIVTGVPDCVHQGNFAYEVHQALPSVSLSIVTPSGRWYAMASLAGKHPFSQLRLAAEPL